MQNQLPRRFAGRADLTVRLDLFKRHNKGVHVAVPQLAVLHDAGGPVEVFPVRGDDGTSHGPFAVANGAVVLLIGELNVPVGVHVHLGEAVAVVRERETERHRNGERVLSRVLHGLDVCQGANVDGPVRSLVPAVVGERNGVRVQGQLRGDEVAAHNFRRTGRFVNVHFEGGVHAGLSRRHARAAGNRCHRVVVWRNSDDH